MTRQNAGVSAFSPTLNSPGACNCRGRPVAARKDSEKSARSGFTNGSRFFGGGWSRGPGRSFTLLKQPRQNHPASDIFDHLRRMSDRMRSRDFYFRHSGWYGSHQSHQPGAKAPPKFRMSVLGVTIFISVALALFFVGAFLYHHDFSGGDTLRDSLLPFQKEESSTPDRSDSTNHRSPSGRPLNPS